MEISVISDVMLMTQWNSSHLHRHRTTIVITIPITIAIANTSVPQQAHRHRQRVRNQEIEIERRCQLTEEQDNEIEALQSIYGEDFREIDEFVTYDFVRAFEITVWPFPGQPSLNHSNIALLVLYVNACNDVYFPCIHVLMFTLFAGFLVNTQTKYRVCVSMARKVSRRKSVSMRCTMQGLLHRQ